jgi:diguanylate cyclase (GGDEF)-like protein
MRDIVKIRLLQNMLNEVTKKYDYVMAENKKQSEYNFERSIRDPLTNLYNRQFLVEFSENYFEKIKRKERSSVLIFLDLDNFKQVNDYYGHEKGDEVLVHVANTFRDTFRIYDLIIRYGGDEFIVFIEDLDKEYIDIDIILKVFVNRIETELEKFKISASYGYATSPLEANDLQKMIEIADKRMYIQKRAKKESKILSNKGK